MFSFNEKHTVMKRMKGTGVYGGRSECVESNVSGAQIAELFSPKLTVLNMTKLQVLIMVLII